LVPVTIKSRPAFFQPALYKEISDDYRIAIEGWKARRGQLHKQQQSVTEVNDEAEKVNLLSLSKKQKAARFS
jgi:hypothetical protein